MSVCRHELGVGVQPPPPTIPTHGSVTVLLSIQASDTLVGRVLSSVTWRACQTPSTD